MSTDIALRLLIDIVIIMRQSKFEDDENDEHQHQQAASSFNLAQVVI